MSIFFVSIILALACIGGFVILAGLILLVLANPLADDEGAPD